MSENFASQSKVQHCFQFSFAENYTVDDYAVVETNSKGMRQLLLGDTHIYIYIDSFEPEPFQWKMVLRFALGPALNLVTSRFERSPRETFRFVHIV